MNRREPPSYSESGLRSTASEPAIEATAGDVGPVQQEQNSLPYRVRPRAVVVDVPWEWQPEWDTPVYAQRSPLRTWLGITAGGLAGVLIVLVAVLLLQMQRRPLQPNTAGQNALAVPAAGNSGNTGDNAASPPAPIKGRYPPDFALNTLDGKPLKLSDLRGKPVWINFWASWCPPCRAEMPEMKQRYARFKDKGLVIVGVDLAESADTVKQFVTGNGYDWTFVLDTDNAVGQQYFVSGIPTHLFVGKDGIIKAVQTGGIPGQMMDRYLDMIMSQ